MAEIKIGQELGRYKIVEKLGRGGMAEVYKAYQESLDRYVAIKLMHAFLVSEQDFLVRFQREARSIARLNHPNIVGVYDFDTFGGDTYYLVMEYISGGTLKERLQALASQGEHLPLEDAIRIAMEISEALSYAHQQGMIHRDIKPANIMLNERGKAILTDFGIVKLVGGQSMGYTATGALIGTPAYMSPEQALGKPGDERSDIYSLGVMLYQMVTGSLPFDADTPLAVVMKHVNEPVPTTFSPDVPFRLQEIILKSLAKEPENRFQSAAELATALRRIGPSGDDTGSGYGTTFVQPPDAAVHDTTAPVMQTAVVDTASGKTVVEAGETVGGETAVAPPPAKRFPWQYIGGIVLIAILIIGAIVVFSGGDDDVEPTAAPLVVAADPTETSTATATATTVSPTNTPTIVLTPSQTPDIVASSVAAIRLTEEAQPTETPTPSRTPSPTPTQTPNATATFLAGCTVDVEVVEAHPFQNNSSNSTPINIQFPMYWTLKNIGTCHWPTDLQWAYVDGARFGIDEEDEIVPLELEADVLPDEEIEITTTFFAPSNAATFESIWQLQDLEGEPFGPEIVFEVRTYVPATATPAPTNTPAATATSEVEVTELNYITDFVGCTYQGSDWSCQVRITPFGGAGGPYSVFVFDQPAGQATVIRSFPWDYFARARRCANFNSNVRIIDDGVTPALIFERHLFIDPDDHFDGGCVEQ